MQLKSSVFETLVIIKITRRMENKAPQTGNLKNLLMNTLQIHIIECKKFATVVPWRKNITRPFVKQKYLSTSAAKSNNVQIILNN